MGSNPSNKQTASDARRFLCRREACYRILSPGQKRWLVVEFAKRGKVVYGQAFDLIWLDSAIDLNDETVLTSALDSIRLYEVKSSSRNLKPGFADYFFSLSTAELLSAQSLGEKYRFVFVNEQLNEVLDLSLREVFARSRAIYPAWSVKF